MDSLVFRLSTAAPPGEVSLKPETWRILAQVNGERSIAEIAQAIGMDKAATAQLALSLYQAGVLEISQGSVETVAPPRETVNGLFLEQLTKQLASAIGPLAEIVIDEEIDGLGESRDDFPRDRVPDLVERVSQAIPDDARRLRFQQVMLENIRNASDLDPIDILIKLTNSLITEFREAGYEGDRLLKMAEYELIPLVAGRVQTIRVADGQIDLSGLRVPPSDLTRVMDGWGNIIKRICTAASARLGSATTDSVYRRVYQAVLGPSHDRFRNTHLERVLNP